MKNSKKRNMKMSLQEVLQKYTSWEEIVSAFKDGKISAEVYLDLIEYYTVR